MLVTDEEATIRDLVPDPDNARRHTRPNLDALERSIEEVGLWRSIAIDEHNTIIAGNATVEVAGQMGITRVKIIDADPEEIIAVRRSGLTDEQKRLYAIADNRISELAEWDVVKLMDYGDDILEAMFDDEQIKKFEQELSQSINGEPTEEDPIEDDPANRPAPTSELGDLWLLGKHRLYCGDATKDESYAAVLNGAVPSMAFADPPYNVGLKYNEHADDMDQGSYEAFCYRYLAELLARSELVAITPGKWNEALYYQHPQYVDHAIWNKRFGLTHGTMYRAMITEPVVFLGKKPTNKWLDTDYLEYMTDRTFDHESHPAIKPVALLAHLMVKLTEFGDTIL
jgi:hypothetical protein